MIYPNPAPLPLSTALLLVALALPGAAPAWAGQKGSAQAEQPEETEEERREKLVEEQRERAIELIEDEELEEARRVLDELLITRYLWEAEEALATGRVEDGLVAIDRVLVLAPENAKARLMKADGSFQLAEKARAAERSSAWIEGLLAEALAAYKTADSSAHTLFGAARCAWLLGDTEAALNFAREGMQAVQREGPGSVTRSLLLPERIMAETAYTAYRAAHERAESTASALHGEAEAALMQLLGRTSDDPWVWGSLAELYESGERLGEARGLLERALARLPRDPSLMAALARVARRTEGRPGVVAVFASYNERNPSIAPGYRYEALERFWLALERMNSENLELLAEELRRAEEGFRKCRQLDPAETELCLSYETSCRNARGWCALNQGALENARREFLSMNELIEGGIEWSISTVLESGIRGLEEVADGYRQRSDWLSAGEISEIQRELQPFEHTWARNAAEFLQKAALELEQQGQRLCRAALAQTTNAAATWKELRALAGIAGDGAFTNEERKLFELAAQERFERARRLMDRSWVSYRKAVELAPGDLRLANDAAAVLVRYLHRDLDTAEQLLGRCIERGGRAVGEEEARLARSPEQGDQGLLWELKNAWGDAHQNMGILAFLHRSDAEAAHSWIERAIEIGPDPRPDLSNGLLPWLRGERSGNAPEFEAYERWGQQCQPSDASAPVASDTGTEKDPQDTDNP